MVSMNQKERKFIQTVWDYYAKEGRQHLPWRSTKDPYRILLSEIMLQQTQVERVIPKYEAFLEKFPTLAALSKAPLSQVLGLWQGLGYNRRAKMLHECAKAIVKDHHGVFPSSHAELVKLPGIGPYTGGAVLAFAFNTGTPIIETNIRTVFLHHFFSDTYEVSDAEILSYVTKTLDTEDPRSWYYALMDYGSYIKKTHGNPNVRSKHHVKPSAFKGSDREIRGALLKRLLKSGATRVVLQKELPFEDIRIDAQLERMCKEGLLLRRNGRYILPN
jgi:A/G-specific adenine glycosylase